MSIEIVREWTDKKLAQELRSGMREQRLKDIAIAGHTMSDPYTVLFAEALARLLERKSGE